MPCPHNKWSGQWYCPEMDETGKGENKEGKNRKINGK